MIGETGAGGVVVELDAAFAEFWALYPRKQKRGLAEHIWASLDPDAALLARILATVTQLAARLMQAGSANDALRRYGPVAELLGSSVPAWPELDARLDGWLDAARAAGVEV